MTSVIVIDDDVDSVYIISEFLKLKGFSIAGSGTNGKEAVEMFLSKLCEKEIHYPSLPLKIHSLPTHQTQMMSKLGTFFLQRDRSLLILR